jgi:hypothetical protein
MGRVVVLVFFVVGFFIFALIKAAATGVKAAYNAVNDPVGFQAEVQANAEEQKVRLARFIVLSLGEQVVQMGGSTPVDIPEHGQDDWSQGYLLGFARSCANLSGLIGDAAIVELIVFTAFFGHEKCYFKRNKISRLVTSGSTAARHGFSIGESDAAAWVASFNAPNPNWPAGWLNHVNALQK